MYRHPRPQDGPDRKWLRNCDQIRRRRTGRFLERYTGALLVIHGDRDTIIPYEAGRRVFEQAPSSRKTFVTIPGADHNDLHIVDPATYWRGVDQFLAALPAR